MRISIFGLGYVGAVSAACLAKNGHVVIGVDTNPSKVEAINAGKSPIVEAEVPEMIAAAVEEGALSATLDAERAVLDTDISLICVGTPSRRDGSLDVDAVERVCSDIGRALAQKDRHVVTVRSTMLPGTVAGTVIPALEKTSGKTVGADMAVCINPEFLREGTAVYDFYNPPKTVVGGHDREAVDTVLRLYEGLDAPVVATSFETAEMVKYTDNCWHAVKVAFANEIGNICQAVGVDSREVADIFLKDTKLNVSAAYLRPGFAFGGSCLPKDLRALNYKGRSLALDLPLLSSVLPSNRVQVDRAVEAIMACGSKEVAFLGISFKEGTDDMRESPQVEVVERLIGKGYKLRIFDSNVRLSELKGVNKQFILETIPHIASLMTDDLDEALSSADVVVVGNKAPEFAAVPAKLRAAQILIDMAGLAGGDELGGRYRGINW